MAFSGILRSICAKGMSLSRRGIRDQGCCANWVYRRGIGSGVQRNQDSSPWLMLPPEFEGGMMSYKFYSLAENKVRTPCSDVIRKLRRLPCIGTSLGGWLALLSPQKDGFFLYNPISRRHIELPSILNLPRWRVDGTDSSRKVTKVILSSSPEEDEENCRAVMINACANAFFCCPGRSKEWTMMGDEKKRIYDDFVYSTRLKLFIGLINYSGLGIWDLQDPSSPRLINIINMNIAKYHNFSSPERLLCGTRHHLVVAEQDLLLVVQYIMDHVAPDGSFYHYFDEHRPVNCTHMTIGFDIFKYDPSQGNFDYIDSSSLGDLALFIGIHSQSVAISATQFPELKPNSVYFTDPYYTPSSFDDDRPFGGHDIGIFNYQDKTVSSCYYPRDLPSLKKILPAPMWFFPSHPI